jgi:hypothetical protein
MSNTIVLAKTLPNGKITGMSLAQWAQEFNQTHRLPKPKEASKK